MLMQFIHLEQKTVTLCQVFLKLDQVVPHDTWQECYPTGEVCFMPEGEYDHSLALLSVYPQVVLGRKPFKYFNMWKSSPRYHSIIETGWKIDVSCTKMYGGVNKLKNVKKELKELNKRGFNCVQIADSRAYHIMIDAQNKMHQNPRRIEFADVELEANKEYHMSHKVYLEFLKQKANLEWFKDGDENTTLFHQSIKASVFRTMFMVSMIVKVIGKIHKVVLRLHS